MSWIHNLWPFNRQKAEEQKRIEAEFQEQLTKAIERRGDLEDAAKQLREDRQRRQAEMVRMRLHSRPSYQE